MELNNIKLLSCRAMIKSHVNKLLISKYEISAIDIVPSDKSCAFDFVM